MWQGLRRAGELPALLFLGRADHGREKRGGCLPEWGEGY